MIFQNVLNSENVNVISELGGMQVVEYARDMSVSPWTSTVEYFCAQMKVNRRQLFLNLTGNSYTIQSGAMQWMSGNINMNTGVKGAGDLVGKFVGSKVTGESAIKPVYSGVGQMMLEPTYRHILLTDVASWGGSIVLDDGLFLACDSTLQQKVVSRTNLSSAVLGREGLFNLSLRGNGVCALESIVPMEELFEIVLQDDVMKIDGNMAIAWSGSLDFSVEKSSKSLLGSAVSGEGFVNVFRGTGKIWMAPVISNVASSAGETAVTENESSGNTGSKSGKKDIMGKIETVGNIIDLFS